jgi:hypothetical protein
MGFVLMRKNGEIETTEDIKTANELKEFIINFVLIQIIKRSKIIKTDFKIQKFLNFG